MRSNKKTTEQQGKPLLSRRNLLKTLGAGLTGGAALYGADKFRLFPGTDALTGAPTGQDDLSYTSPQR